MNSYHSQGILQTAGSELRSLFLFCLRVRFLQHVIPDDLGYTAAWEVQIVVREFRYQDRQHRFDTVRPSESIIRVMCPEDDQGWTPETVDHALERLLER